MAAVDDLITENIDVWTSAIKRKSSAGRGGGKKIELYGVKKLRELILDLAVRGLLVPQDPDDEPASVLLERITAEKAELVNAKKIRKPKYLEESVESIKPHLIPKGWKWVRLGEITSSSTGRAFKSAEYTENGTFVLRVTNINEDSTISPVDPKYIPKEIAKTTYSQFALAEGDLLMVMVGGSLGKIGVVDKNILPAVLNQNMWRFNRSGLLCSHYLKQGLGFINRSQLEITKSTHGHLVQRQYLAKFFPLPPLPEQHRIVAKVDELMALCDQLEQQTESSITAHQTLVQTLLGALTQAATQPNPLQSATTDTPTPFTQAWSRLAEHFDTVFTTEDSIEQLKQTILQLAVMGKLVPQDPNDEPASELLKRIAAEKAELVKAKKIKKQKALPEIGENEKPFELPDGWEWANIDDIFTVSGGIQKTPKRAPICNHYPYLAVANVQRNRLELDGISHFELMDGELERYILESQDLLIVEGNGSESEIGRCAIWNNEVVNCVHQNHLIRCRPISKELSIWTLTVLNSPFGTDEMKSLSVTTSGLYNLSVGKIRNIQMPIPPLSEQCRMVTKLDELMTRCDQLRVRLTDAQSTQLQLTDAVTVQAIQ